MTKISSSMPAAAARRRRSIGNGQTGKNAKYQNRCIASYGLTIASDARYETQEAREPADPDHTPHRGVAQPS